MTMMMVVVVVVVVVVMSGTVLEVRVHKDTL